ncbi:methyl-accepting chemotaxis protein [Roseateles sp.]|uniref:methyl-accepting chemotaxis protein n=1 Tax=Roseateles sp. TaxID=1971397 RepID=UPI0031D7A156
MFSFARLKLGQQLLLAFSLCAVMLVSIGAMNVVRLRQLSRMQEEMVQEEVRPLALIRTASWQAATHFRRAYSYILKADAAGREETLALNRKSEADVLAAIDFERAHPVDDAQRDEQRAALEAFATLWPRYVESMGRLQALARADDRDGAFAELNKTTDPTHVAIRKQLIQLGELREGSAKHRADDGVALVRHEAWMLAGLVTLGVLVAQLAGWWVTRRVTRQLGGEPGDAAALVGRVAAGDLAATVPLREGDEHSLMARLAAMREELVAVIGGVRQGAESVATASEQIAHGNLDLSQRTEMQASALQQTAAAMEELGSTVRQNADNARLANGLAHEAGSVARDGGRQVGEVVDLMGRINASAGRMADIIGTIDGIAFQTNILALNAAVEAARAGEHGRGFAVVASEVRALAQRSAGAAREIKGLIETNVGEVDRGMALVREAGRTMDGVQAAIGRVTDVMGEIRAASEEQSTGVAQVGEAVQQMDQATQQNAALVEETAAAADSLKSQSGQLVAAVSVFRLK